MGCTRLARLSPWTKEALFWFCIIIPVIMAVLIGTSVGVYTTVDLDSCSLINQYRGRGETLGFYNVISAGVTGLLYALFLAILLFAFIQRRDRAFNRDPHHNANMWRIMIGYLCLPVCIMVTVTSLGHVSLAGIAEVSSQPLNSTEHFIPSSTDLHFWKVPFVWLKLGKGAVIDTEWKVVLNKKIHVAVSLPPTNKVPLFFIPLPVTGIECQISGTKSSTEYEPSDAARTVTCGKKSETRINIEDWVVVAGCDSFGCGELYQGSDRKKGADYAPSTAVPNSGQIPELMKTCNGNVSVVAIGVLLSRAYYGSLVATAGVEVTAAWATAIISFLMWVIGAVIGTVILFFKMPGFTMTRAAMVPLARPYRREESESSEEEGDDANLVRGARPDGGYHQAGRELLTALQFPSKLVDIFLENSDMETTLVTESSWDVDLEQRTVVRDTFGGIKLVTCPDRVQMLRTFVYGYVPISFAVPVAIGSYYFASIRHEYLALVVLYGTVSLLGSLGATMYFVRKFVPFGLVMEVGQGFAKCSVRYCHPLAKVITMQFGSTLDDNNDTLNGDDDEAMLSGRRGAAPANNPPTSEPKFEFRELPKSKIGCAVWLVGEIDGKPVQIRVLGSCTKSIAGGLVAKLNQMLRGGHYQL